ncbi:MAG: class I SAM-dependent methyltransferase [Gloeocapsa sp. DLM2.Bin57]|nr:MAG: class I SAM-dependent methyltransferase [Gloeocapsa sp. DLM2.Bin57]
MLFDQDYYLSINHARWETAKPIIQTIQTITPLHTCLDVGCGPGWFADKLVNLGLKVQGIDGRQDLLDIASQRVPDGNFSLVDVESKTAMSNLQTADLVFCFGLIYHTENPFRVIRNLASLTQKILFIESMVIPVDQPVSWLVEEGKNETQGLTYHAMIPSSSCLVKMLQVSGIPHIYRYTAKIEHIDFLDTPEKHRRRQVFLASQIPLNLTDFIKVAQIETPKYDFSKT